MNEGIGTTGGVGELTFDLSEARGQGVEEPPETFIGGATTVVIENAPSEAYVRFGSPTNPRYDTDTWQGFRFDTPPRYMFVENPAGTGTLRVVTGEGDAELTPKQTIRAVSDSVEFDVSSRSGRNLGKSRLMDSAGVLVDPLHEGSGAFRSATDSGTGAGNAATVTTGPVRTNVDVFVDTSGSATLTVEVSPDDGSTWRYLDTVSYSSSTTEMEQYDTVYPDVRAYLDQNRNVVELATGGIS